MAIPNLKLLLLKANVEEPSDELVFKREQAIEKYSTENISLSRFLHLIRFVFSLETSSDFVDNLRKTFKEFDSEFPDRGRLYELKMLSSAILLHLIDAGSILTMLKLQLAISNCYGFGLRENPRDIDIVKASEDVLQRNLTNLRSHVDIYTLRATMSLKLDEFQEVIESMDFADPEESAKEMFIQFGSNIVSLSNRLVDTVEQISRNTFINDEEIRILWWVSSNYSEELRRPWKEVKWYDACMAVSKELSDLVMTDSGPASYREIINRILEINSDNRQQPSNLLSFVLAASLDLRKSMVQNIATHIDELTPIHYAILKSLEAKSKKALQSILEKSKIKVSKQLQPLTLGIQLYRERLYLRNIQLGEDNG